MEFAWSAPVDCEPLNDLAPAQAPEPTQEEAFVAAHVIVALPPLVIELGVALMLMVGDGALTDTLAVCEALPPVPTQVKT